MKPRKHWWIWLLVATYIWFIFSNSLMVADASSKLSTKVTWYLINHLQRFGLYADFYTFHHYVRKLAHFTEFAGLGFLVTLAMHICPLFKSRFLNFTLFLVAIPVADETIQHFVEGRSSEYFDMLIDGGGFLAGGFFCYVLILILLDIFKRKPRHA
jgi:VanZ family protein